MRSPRLLALTLAVGLIVGCEGPTPDDTVRPSWHGVDLPMPPGSPGRIMLRDAAACGGRWYVVGAIGGADGATRPAAWSSADATSWTPLRLQPLNDSYVDSYYGKRAILYAVGCYQGRVAVIGAKAGGAHGNPRVNTWRQLPDGSLAQVPADFQMYGGPTAVNASRMAGGPGGWLIAGGRESGAAVWRSPDAASFEILEGVAPLASDAAMATGAADAIAAPGGGWLVGGSGRRVGRADRDPLVWASTDGVRWRRLDLPATDDDEAVQRLVPVTGGVLALGVRAGGFAAWRWAGAGGLPTAGSDWRATARFGAAGVGAVAGVEAAASDAAGVVAASVGADGHRMWTAPPAGDRWRAVLLPAEVPPGGDTATSVAAADGRLLLTTDNGVDARTWIADFPHPMSGTR
jgi:hypothetical protein